MLNMINKDITNNGKNIKNFFSDYNNNINNNKNNVDKKNRLK